jgi:hypothetical protein
MRAFKSVIVILMIFTTNLHAQQVADTLFQPVIDRPSYSIGKGPVVSIDEAHNNFHTLNGRYQAFAKVLQSDGYIVKSFRSHINSDSLTKIDILVISNALNERNLEDWSLPTPSAFSKEEIITISSWVKNGGALLLIADHMPFPGAAKDLAASFGFFFNNGFAVDTVTKNITIFNRSDGSLVDHPITKGRNDMERIDSVRTFTGQAFQANSKAQPLLIFGKSTVSLMPEEAWQFDDNTSRISVEGWFQGAIMRHGNGRIAVFGEAAMFTAQRTESGWFGLKSAGAEQNQQFLLNIMHWLSRMM